MGSGLSCCRCPGSGRRKDFRPSKANENDSKRIQREYLTLEDWLSADDCEIQALRRFSIKIHESLLNDIDRGGGGGEFSSSRSRDSISEAGRGGLEVIASLERSRSGKAQKRVSFRLPESSDIIIFDSPGSGCSGLEAQKRDESLLVPRGH